MKDFFYGAVILLYAGLSYFLALQGKPAELAGFVVAGALSLVFLKLDSFTEFSGGGFKAKLRERVEILENDIAPMKSKATEPEELESNTVSKPEDFFLDSDTQKVLFALTNGKYSWRTMGGIKADTKFRPSQVLNTLLRLEKDGLARKGKSSSGSEIWGATDKGYSVESLHFPGSNRENA